MNAEQAAIAVAHGPVADASPPPTRTVLGAIIAVAVAVAATCAWLLVSSPYRGEVDESTWLIHLVGNLFTVSVGLVAWRVKPGNRVGPLLVLVGFVSLIDFLSLSGDGLAWTIGDMWNLLGIVVLANVYLAFPAGRTSGWSRRLVVAVYGWFFAWSIGLRVMDAYPTDWPFQNPLLLWPNEQLVTALSMVADLGALVLAVLVVATVLERWRRGSFVARRALAPVVWVSPITLVVVGAYFVGRLVGSDALLEVSTGPLAQVSAFLLPTAFLLGLLQTRLQRGSIADLVRDLDNTTAFDLEAALARALHDPSLRLAFTTTEGPGYVDVAGQPLAMVFDGAPSQVTRIQAGDETIAVLLHDPAVDPAIVESAAAASRLALENARLAAELRAQLEAVRSSRARIVQAADVERRRLERDLHDGAQQRLVALGFTLRQAAKQAAADTELRVTLEKAQGELEDALRELRVLARGIHPLALADGLVPAIHDLADRSPIPVEVAFEPQPYSLPKAVETTAYFITAEALTNALRHAGASRVAINGSIQDGALCLEIVDDGIGGAAEADAGSGIHGLLDRAQAVGGTLAVHGRTGGGTIVRAIIPLG